MQIIRSVKKFKKIRSGKSLNEKTSTILDKVCAFHVFVAVHCTLIYKCQIACSGATKPRRMRLSSRNSISPSAIQGGTVVRNVGKGSN